MLRATSAARTARNHLPGHVPGAATEQPARRRTGAAGLRTVPLALALAVALAMSLLIGAPGGAAVEPAPRKHAGFAFKIGTFNVLGSQHTRGRGGYAAGTKRARWTAGAISKRGIDVIGLQEVQRDQLRVLRTHMPRYRFWPRTTLGNQGVRLQIAFRKERFRLVAHGHVDTRFDRQTRPIPWVKLRDRRTGRPFFVVDVHNSPRGMESERDSATARQVRLVKRLRRTGAPVFLTADANEKREFYCKMTGGTDLRAANGGKAGARGCKPPRRRLRIDWILGGRRVEFSRYDEDRGPRVRRSSDHELVHARALVRPVRGR